MSAPTPDRAALAERLREMLAEVRRTQRAVAKMGFSPESLRDESLARIEGQAEALAAAIAALAAPPRDAALAERLRHAIGALSLTMQDVRTYRSSSADAERETAVAMVVEHGLVAAAALEVQP